ncbi:hypothetical protein [Streptacidiphilus sp. PAMC 29251]
MTTVPTDPRHDHALPLRHPGTSVHRPRRPAYLCADAVEPSGTTLYYPDRSRAAARAQVLAQLAQGRRLTADRRAGREPRW